MTLVSSVLQNGQRISIHSTSHCYQTSSLPCQGVVLYTGNCWHISNTLFRTPLMVLAFSISSRTSQIQPARDRTCSALNPRVVTAGVPMRIPLVTNGDLGSLGTLFLLTVILAAPSAASASFPVMPLPIRSTRKRWLSVPPDTILYPRLCMTDAI